MDSGHDKKRTNVAEDRLSSLPDDLIHKILSYIGIKQAIKTSGLSSRWRSVWTSMPYLDFSTEDFSTLLKFSKFVSHVLSRRNNLVDVVFLKLGFRGKASHAFVKRIIKYATSHNVQRLSVICWRGYELEFPLSLFCSQSLKHLSLTSRIGWLITPTSSWELPALTTLHISSIRFPDGYSDHFTGLISKCVNLKNLTLGNFYMMGSNELNVCHSRLSHLTIEYVECSVSVITPRLKHLSIRGISKNFLISAPDLADLLLEGDSRCRFSADGLRSLERVKISIGYPRKKDAHKFVELLQLFQSVKFLTLNLEIVELLSSSVDLILHQPSPFANLKSLNIYPARELSVAEEQKKVKISQKVKKYLLDSSPGATFTMVSRKDIVAERIAASAQKLMAELRVLLEKETANNMTNIANTNRGKAPMESHDTKMGKAQTEMKSELQIGGSMAPIMSCWVDLSVHIEKKQAKTCLIILKLQDIEKLVTKLPASKKAIIQPCFSSVCAEADIVISKITDCLKIQCDKNLSEIATTCHHLLNK